MKSSFVIKGLLIACLAWWATQSLTPAPPEVSADASISLTTRENALRDSIQPRIDRNQVKAQLHRVRTALYQYNVESGEVPTGFGEIVNSGLLQWSDVTDPWGRKFAFRSEKKTSNAFMEEYEIFVYSLGPDGAADSTDDIFI